MRRMENMEKGVRKTGSMGYGSVEFANDTCNEMGITSHGLYLKNGKQCEPKKLKHIGGVDQTHFLSVKP